MSQQSSCSVRVCSVGQCFELVCVVGPVSDWSVCVDVVDVLAGEWGRGWMCVGTCVLLAYGYLKEEEQSP